jgi:hypothetical protein
MSQDRALAATAAAHDDHGFAPQNLETDAIQNRASTESPYQVTHLDDRPGFRAGQGNFGWYRGVRYHKKKKSAVRMAFATRMANNE